MTRSRNHVVALAATAIGLLTASPAFAAWQNSFSDFGATLKGDLYTPSKLADSPAILVAIHMCSGHSSTVHGWFDSYADTNGFYIIAPDAGKNCFDASLGRTDDKAAVVTMVNYLIKNKNADKTRVFAAGMSSGGCMTNTLLAAYPDVFAGGSAMPGFPAGAWPAGDTMCSKCGSTPPSTDGKYWGDMVRKVFMWSGQYGCSQQWVGGGDQYNFNGWLPAVAAQFQNLSSLDAGAMATGRSGWARMEYKDSAGNVRLQTNLGPSGQKHDLETVSPTLYGDVITFLGLDKPTGGCGLATTSTAGGSGGGTGAGGMSPGNGGTMGNGGAKAAGGSTGSGGGTAAGSGGTTGGSASGGTTASASGGTSGGSSGGKSGSASGGSNSTSSGGSNSSSGGTTGSGGMLAGSGGKSSSGGSTGSGGSDHNGSGGSSSSGSGGSGSGENGSSGGCAVAGGPAAGSLAMLMFIALGLVIRRRSRR